MQDIWDEHHRQLREIDRRFKRKKRILIAIAVVLFIAYVVFLYKY
jgi:flagellar biosynthesis/type III secretory pathway M-ring protein FliF/YscJ